MLRLFLSIVIILPVIDGGCQSLLLGGRGFPPRSHGLCGLCCDRKCGIVALVIEIRLLSSRPPPGAARWTSGKHRSHALPTRSRVASVRASRQSVLLGARDNGALVHSPLS